MQSVLFFFFGGGGGHRNNINKKNSSQVQITAGQPAFNLNSFMKQKLRLPSDNNGCLCFMNRSRERTAAPFTQSRTAIAKTSQTRLKQTTCTCMHIASSMVLLSRSGSSTLYLPCACICNAHFKPAYPVTIYLSRSSVEFAHQFLNCARLPLRNLTVWFLVDRCRINQYESSGNLWLDNQMQLPHGRCSRSDATTNFTRKIQYGCVRLDSLCRPRCGVFFFQDERVQIITHVRPRKINRHRPGSTQGS